ncbi:MAG: GNAT family N-acetyltransferase [Candidatus Omnitrophota bacterium]
MENKITEIRRVDYANPEWREFLNGTNHTIFHTSLWQKVVSQAYKADSAIYAYYKEGTIKIALVGFIFDWKVCRVLYASLFDGGMVGDYTFIQEFIEQLIPLLKKDKIDKIRIMQTYSTSFKDISGFKKIEESQHIVRLDSIDKDKLWNGLYRNRIRKAIRQSINSGVVIEEIKDVRGIETLYKLNRETIKRNKTFSTFSKSILIDFYKNFLMTGQGKAWLAKKDDIYIAGLLVVYSQNASHGMAAGSLDKFFNLRANDLLLHEGMLDAINNKKLYFDFMLTSKNKINLQFYKDKFGGEEYTACFYEKDISKMRPFIWGIIWRLMHTPLIGWFIRTFQ